MVIVVCRPVSTRKVWKFCCSWLWSMFRSPMIVMTAVGCLCCVSFILLCSSFVKVVMSVFGRLYMQMKMCTGVYVYC